MGWFSWKYGLMVAWERGKQGWKLSNCLPPGPGVCKLLPSPNFGAPPLGPIFSLNWTILKEWFVGHFSAIYSLILDIFVWPPLFPTNFVEIARTDDFDFLWDEAWGEWLSHWIVSTRTWAVRLLKTFLTTMSIPQNYCNLHFFAKVWQL